MVELAQHHLFQAHKSFMQVVVEAVRTHIQVD
jgi:hypothetical protein